MDRMQKEALVTQTRETLQQAAVVVVTQQTGLTVGEVTNLRREMRAANANFKVIKNTLAQIAIEGTALECLKEHFSGPTAVAYSDDPISAPKVIDNFAKKNEKLKVVAGALAGKVLSADEVKALASMPSLDELRGMLVGLIMAPATKVVRTIKEPSAKVARVISLKVS